MEVLNTVLTVVSLIGGAVSWWMANQSRSAKAKSEIALYNAREELKASREQAAALMELADQGRPPLLEATYKTGDTWLLTNTGDGDLVISEVLNGEAEGLHTNLDGVRILARGSMRFLIVPMHLPGQQHVLRIQLEGHPGPISVPYPPKPRRPKR